jgi:cystathionine beta-lyase
MRNIIMKYDFDREINRKDTQSAKWGVIQDRNNPSRWHATDAYFGEDRVLPLWVADMDFPSPQPVVDALVRRAQHGIYGYTIRTEGYDRAVVAWMKRRHGWEIDPGWIVATPGVVPAVNFLVQTFAGPGAKVLIQRPVYYPFFTAIEHNGAEIVSSSLVLNDGRYEMDFADFENKAADPATVMFILCSPHNPVGRVWTRQELNRIGDICLKHEVLVVADEIHADLIYKGITFSPFAAISDALAQNTVVCTAPSKTFNLAGSAYVQYHHPQHHAQATLSADHGRLRHGEMGQPIRRAGLRNRLPGRGTLAGAGHGLYRGKSGLSAGVR